MLVTHLTSLSWFVRKRKTLTEGTVKLQSELQHLTMQTTELLKDNQDLTHKLKKQAQVQSSQSIACGLN